MPGCCTLPCWGGPWGCWWEGAADWVIWCCGIWVTEGWGHSRVHLLCLLLRHTSISRISRIIMDQLLLWLLLELLEGRIYRHWFTFNDSRSLRSLAWNTRLVILKVVFNHKIKFNDCVNVHFVFKADLTFVVLLARKTFQKLLDRHLSNYLVLRIECTKLTWIWRCFSCCWCCCNGSNSFPSSGLAIVIVDGFERPPFTIDADVSVASYRPPVVWKWTVANKVSQGSD